MRRGLAAALLVPVLAACAVPVSHPAAPHVRASARSTPAATAVDAPSPSHSPSHSASHPTSPRPSRSPAAARRPRVHHHRPPAQHRPAGVPTAAMPDLRLTPGRALKVSARQVCVSGYASRVRDVPESEATAVYARYGVVHVPYAHEVDHLVSLELGGSNALANLWPEPYAGRWGARTKDVLENRLHDLVCSGRLALRRAQRLEAGNWVAAYLRFVGVPPRAAAPSHRPHPLVATSGGCEPGYAPCLPRVADLDCDQIPADRRPVRVTGADPYRLDADGNGWGCTS